MDLEVLSIDRNSFVDLLNTYEGFAATFVMICEKREEHKKGKAPGQKRMTGKLQKSAENMVRPVTPPPGVTWKQIPRGSVTEAAKDSVENVDRKAKQDHGAHRVHYGEIFDDESVPALLDKLQYNIGSQLDDIQDHLDHLEDRIDDLEDERGGGGGGGTDEGSKGRESRDGFSIGEPLGSSPQGRVGEGEDEELSVINKSESEVSPLGVGSTSFRKPWEGSPARSLGRRASVKSQRMLARESSKFKSLQSKKAINESPHEY